MREEMLVIENGRISSGGNEIFRELYLQIYKAEIFGIIFDNILDQKCLLDFLKGNSLLDSGSIYVNSQRVALSESPKHFESFVSVVEKTSKLIDSLSIPENVLLFAETMHRYVVEKKKYGNYMDELVRRLNVSIQTDKPVSGLTSRERVLIELIKAYAEGKKLVALVDVAAFLKSAELEEVFSLMVRLGKSGMTFILVESLGEIAFKWAERLAIVRNGKTLGIFRSNDIKRQQVYSALIGDQQKQPYNRMVSIVEAEAEELRPVLKFVNINTDVLKNLNLSVNRGEVLKIFYMDDSSLNHIVGLMKGQLKPSSGGILVNGREYRAKDTHQAVTKGVCFVEESPYKSMLIFDMSVLDNLCLTLAKKLPLIWVKRRYAKSIRETIARFIGDDIGNTKLSALPPVKLQQIAYLKWFIFAPSVVVCIRPFTEVDIHLREVTVNMIELLRRRGISVVILTPNFSETYLIEGETVYIRSGSVIGEDEVYQIIYGSK